MVYLTCAVISLGGQGVIKTWTEVAARVHLYMLTSDLTSLVPPQFSHWLQVRKVSAVYFILFYLFIFFKQEMFVKFLFALNGDRLSNWTYSTAMPKVPQSPFLSQSQLSHNPSGEICRNR